MSEDSLSMHVASTIESEPDVATSSPGAAALDSIPVPAAPGSTSAPPAMPPSGAALREAILTAATEVAIRRGAAALRIRAVAERAGCGVASVYDHIGSREALLGAVRVALLVELPANARERLAACTRDASGAGLSEIAEMLVDHVHCLMDLGALANGGQAPIEEVAAWLARYMTQVGGIISPRTSSELWHSQATAIVTLLTKLDDRELARRMACGALVALYAKTHA